MSAKSLILSPSLLPLIINKLSKLENLDKILADNLDLIFSLISYSHILATEVIKFKPHFFKFIKSLIFRLKIIIGTKTAQYKEKVQTAQDITAVTNLRNEELFTANQNTYNHFFDLRYSNDLYGVISSISNIKLVFKTLKSVLAPSKSTHSLIRIAKALELLLFATCVFLEALGVAIYANVMPRKITEYLQEKFQIDDLCDWAFTIAYKFITVKVVVDHLKAGVTEGVVPTFTDFADLVFIHSWGWPEAVNKPLFAGTGFFAALIRLKDVIRKL